MLSNLITDSAPKKNQTKLHFVELQTWFKENYDKTFI